MATQLPYNFKPRAYQLPLFRYLTSDARDKQACVVWNRRAGKDLVCLHAMAVMAYQHPGSYWHMWPKFSHARRAAWNAVDDRTHKRVLHSIFPPDIVQPNGYNEHEMQIKLRNGSIISLMGADEPDRLVGAPPVWITISEAALTSPLAIDYLSPIIATNHGTRVFISTPRGDNWFKKQYDDAIHNPDWFCQLLTVDDTKTLTKAALDKELKGMQVRRGDKEGLSLWQQEFYCSWTAALEGAYFGSFMEQAEKEGRIGFVPHNPAHPVHMAWDLGVNDQTVVWAGQVIDGAINFIDCISGTGNGIEHYVAEIKTRPWTLGTTILPHDAGHREQTSARTRLSAFRTLGIQNIQLLANERVADGIQAVRLMLPSCRFDAKRCEKGIQALKQYRREYDDMKDLYLDKPVHDRTSDFADAFRYFALGNIRSGKKTAIKYRSDWVI